MCAYVSLQVEGIVEAFTAEAAQVSLGLVVAFKMSVQHALVLESLLANLSAATPQLHLISHHIQPSFLLI